MNLTEEQRALLRRTQLEGATDDEAELFFMSCERSGLDPFRRQIWAQRRWDKRQGRQVVTALTTIEGFRCIAIASGEYRGADGPYWCGPEEKWRNVWLSRESPPSAAAIEVHRDKCIPRRGTAVWEEYVPLGKDGAPQPMWRKMPALMLAKCAEALAIRAAFSLEVAGLYTAEEMAQADNPEPSGKLADDVMTPELVANATANLQAKEDDQTLAVAMAADLEAMTTADELEHWTYNHAATLSALHANPKGKLWRRMLKAGERLGISGAALKDAITAGRTDDAMLDNT